MVALMVIGLLWIVVYYVAGDRIPFMVSLSAWNFAIGFGAMVATPGCRKTSWPAPSPPPASPSTRTRGRSSWTAETR